MSAGGHRYNFYHMILCLQKDCRTLKENYVLYERSLCVIFPKLMNVWKVNFFWRNNRTEELCIRPFYSNESVCFSPLLLPPSVSEAGLQIGVATYQYLDREAFGGVNFPSYVLFTLRLFYWSTSVIFEFGLYLWMILSKEEKWSVPRSLHPGQSQFSQVSVTLKVQCKGIFLLVRTWTHLPKPPYPAATLSLHAHL